MPPPCRHGVGIERHEKVRKTAGENFELALRHPAQDFGNYGALANLYYLP
jgi:hypothetical protein